MITRKGKLSEDVVVTQPNQAYFCDTFFTATRKQFQFFRKIIDVPSTDTKMNHVFVPAAGSGLAILPQANFSLRVNKTFEI